VTTRVFFFFFANSELKSFKNNEEEDICAYFKEENDGSIRNVGLTSQAQFT
jgi:hypothetical protein